MTSGPCGVQGARGAGGAARRAARVVPATPGQSVDHHARVGRAARGGAPGVPRHAAGRRAGAGRGRARRAGAAQGALHGAKPLQGSQTTGQSHRVRDLQHQCPVCYTPTVSCVQHKGTETTGKRYCACGSACHVLRAMWRLSVTQTYVCNASQGCGPCRPWRT